MNSAISFVPLQLCRINVTRTVWIFYSLVQCLNSQCFWAYFMIFPPFPSVGVNFFYNSEFFIQVVVFYAIYYRFIDREEFWCRRILHFLKELLKIPLVINNLHLAFSLP